MTGRSGTVRRALGLISGTSMDGVDLALLETDGQAVVRFGPTGFIPYEEHDRALLRDALVDAAGLTDRGGRPGRLAEAERRVTDLHGTAIEVFARDHAIDLAGLDVVGFHGQTVLHRPDIALTVQIGDGQALARRLGVRVVADFRAEDMAAGGQGAPLVPAYHQALALSSGMPSVMLVNIGGVANITYLPEGSGPVACDTGPGNALLDDLMLERTGEAMDRDGSMAAGGAIDGVALAQLLSHPFFDLPIPKSLDRNAFSRAPVADLSTADAAATLTAFTAAGIARVLPHLTGRPTAAIVCGGGARNPTLMTALRRALGCPVSTADDHGWSADAMEAQAFAYLAVRSLDGLPLTFPGTTGVREPVTGGVLFDA